MSLIIGSILSFLFLEWPWRILVLIPLAAFELFEVWLFFRWRNVRSITGVEALIGAGGTAVTDLTPEGNVRVKGQVWQAVASERLKKHARVTVVEVDGLRLKVEPST